MSITGNKSLRKAIGAMVCLCLFVLPVLASDNTPPKLTSFTYSPMSVDVTNNPANVNIAVQATDDLSGVDFVNVGWASPSGKNSVGGTLSLTSGTGLNGTWTLTATVARFVEPGTWNITYLVMEDSVGNASYYYPADLQALGFSTTLQVTSTQDTTAPVLTNFAYSPMSVDVTNNPANVNITVQATDNLSGVDFVNVGWASPSGKNSVGGTLSLTSGTGLNGTWTLTATVARFVEPGTWNITYLVMEDSVGNASYYYPADLQALGFSTTLQVVDGTSVSLGTSSNPSVYGQPVTLTATVTSGSTTIPTGTVDFNDGSTTIGSGTLDASGITTFTTSALALGTHSIVAAYLGDANNPAANSPTLSQVVNKAATTTTITSSLNPSIVGDTVTFRATVASSTGGAVTGGIVTFNDGPTLLCRRNVIHGHAACRTSGLALGTHHIAARYLGGTDLQSSKASIQQVVQ